MLRRFTKPPILALILAVAAIGALSGIDSWAENDLPRIKFLATGGTIATRGRTAGCHSGSSACGSRYADTCTEPDSRDSRGSRTRGTHCRGASLDLRARRW